VSTRRTWGIKRVQRRAEYDYSAAAGSDDLSVGLVHIFGNRDAALALGLAEQARPLEWRQFGYAGHILPPMLFAFGFYFSATERGCPRAPRLRWPGISTPLDRVAQRAERI
jgi:hypothetical protein